MPATITLGCMNFGRRTPRDEALRVLDRALDAGITVLDTANVYNDGASERIVGEAVRGRRGGITIATKVGLGRREGRVEGLSPATVRAACEESLTRLGVDAIDLYYLHAPDPNTPFEATLSALGALLEAGHIRAWGVSNFASWQILELRLLAERAGLPAPAVAQQLYNVLVRQLDVEYFAYARRHPIHTTVYNPLAGGLLAGGHSLDGAPPPGSRFDKNPLYRARYWHPALFEAVAELSRIATETGHTLVQLAYGFLLDQPGVDSILAGPATVAHLDAALAARPLPADVRARVDALYTDLVGTNARYAR